LRLFEVLDDPKVRTIIIYCCFMLREGSTHDRINGFDLEFASFLSFIRYFLCVAGQ
jgi:hypothetical protein